MTAPRRPANLAALDDPALEALLIDLGDALDVPPAPDVSRAVATRLRGAPRPARPALRLRWALIAALIALLAFAAIVAGRGFGLPGLRIFFETPSPTAAPPTPAPTVATASPASPSAPASPTPAATVAPTLAPINGQRTTLDEARRAVAFSLHLPQRDFTPAFVYLDRQVAGGEVILGSTVPESAATANLPLAPDGAGRVAYVLTETRGRIDEGLLGKSLGPGNTITTVDVGHGGAGLWIAGPVHRLLVYDANGSVREAATRDVGNVLAFVRDGVLIRIETTLDLDQAQRIAQAIP